MPTARTARATLGPVASIDASALLDQLPDIVVVVDGDANIVWANRAASEQLGWDLAEMTGRSGIDLIHPDDVPTAATALLSVRDKDVGSAVELRIRDTTNGYRLVELRGRAALDVKGVDGVVLQMRDITDRRQWEVAAGDSALLQAIIDNAPAVTMLLSADGVIKGASRAMTQLLGRDLEFTRGRPLAELAIDADRRLVATEVALVVSNGGRRSFEARFPSVSGRVPVPMSVTAVNLLDDQSVRGLVVTASDITSLAEARAELHHLATHDGLTGLPNRALLRDRLEHAIAGAKRRSSCVGVVYVDVDRFKAVNDELGHAAGDDVLVEVADRLRSVTRTSDTVARVGGDEFVIVIEDDDRSVERLVTRIDQVMAEPIDINGRPITVTVSAGGSSDDSSAMGIDELLARADAAMYRTKSHRRTTPAPIG
jgi:diguanylate cyclase (GGDEF)-like protein/PAS domain S-box-containing protein